MRYGAPIALLDMDGTVADYDVAMNAALDAMRGPGEEGLVWETLRNEPWVEARRDAVARRPGFWRELPERWRGMVVYNMLLELDFEVHVVSKGPSTKSQAWAEKLDWCREHLPNAKVTITESKTGVYGRCLVDDWIPYVEPWLEKRPRGLVIMPSHSWNEGYAHPRVVHDTDLVRVYEALREARNRKDGDPLCLP